MSLWIMLRPQQNTFHLRNFKRIQKQKKKKRKKKTRYMKLKMCTLCKYKHVGKTNT